MRKMFLAAALGAALLSGCAGMSDKMAASEGGAPAKMVGGMAVGTNGMTLYTFDKDEAGSGKSVCNGKCAENWPPLMVESGAKAMGDWTMVTRDDGKAQWAYKGKPVYFWVKDTKPGDMTGDGFNGVWHVIKN